MQKVNFCLIDLGLKCSIGRVNLKIMTSRKEVSTEPPQYNGDFWGLQKRDYLATRETLLSKKFIVGMVIL
jgi:hypothetical protein